ncbi:MAG: sigma-54 dependent transcriptional regulator [Myxococcota bacterium]|nr:sigma-54 dependent transcriptional regulator [Myxococcota bacterium]
MRRVLLTWSDRGVDGPAPAHQARRPPSDRGPVLRLLEHIERRAAYHRAVVLTVPGGLARGQALAGEMAAHVAEVEVRVIDVEDPSDYAALFARLVPFATELERTTPRSDWSIDVLLSAGTPQAQTLWVILVQAAMLRARMLQVIPAAFVPKPHRKAIREINLDIDGFPEVRVLREEVSRLRAEIRVRSSSLIAGSEPMRRLMERVVRVAPSELPVVVHGETGSGKELVARAIHDGSARAERPFIAENCAALAESVLASELFGHEASAFTGAATRHRGLFEQASGGTLFLDEVGELPAQVQAMLLRVLQERTVRRVGGEQAVKVDVRVVVATHRDLEQMVRAGTFREDLFYRLRGATLTVPPLRERTSDLGPLIKAFLDEATQGQPARRLSITPAAMQLLAAYPWPGNVRELRSEVHRWVVFCDDEVTPADLAVEIGGGPGRPPRPRPPARPAAPATLVEVVRAAEHHAITTALAAHDGNLLRSATALGIERNTLKRKLRLLGLYPPKHE